MRAASYELLVWLYSQWIPETERKLNEKNVTELPLHKNSVKFHFAVSLNRENE